MLFSMCVIMIDQFTHDSWKYFSTGHNKLNMDDIKVYFVISSHPPGNKKSVSLFLSYRHIVWLISNFDKTFHTFVQFCLYKVFEQKFLLPSFLSKFFTINLIVRLHINTRLYLAFVSQLVWQRFDIILNTK